MRILAFDTALSACSVALGEDKQYVTRFELAPRQQAKHILPFIEQVLDQAKLSLHQLEALAFTAGPGSFTGIRLAASIAQGLAFALNIPLLPISTLRAMAQTAYTQFHAQRVAVAVDGQAGEIYWGIFQNKEGIMQPLVPDTRCRPDTLPLIDLSEAIGVGDGWQVYNEALSGQIQHLTAVEALFYSYAEDIAKLAMADMAHGLSITADAVLPLYLHDACNWKKTS